MTNIKERPGINALTLKLLAMAFMMCDHLWATMAGNAQWLTCIGRMAFPIFAFQIAEGWAHTSDRKKYRRRILLWAVITEIPFNLMYSGGVIYPFHQNVLFTFWIALLLLTYTDKMEGLNKYSHWVGMAIALVVGYVVGFTVMVDYYGYGVVTVLIFYFTRDLPFRRLVQLLAVGYINFEMGGLVYDLSLLGQSVAVPQQAFALLAFIPIFLYNGKRGEENRAIRLGCYAFYPVHMLILALIAMYF